jgi:excisionase family DNA binding protein
MNKDAMNVDELAERLGISRPKAYELVKQKDFPSIPLGRRIIIPVKAFEEWLYSSSLRANRS